MTSVPAQLPLLGEGLKRCNRCQQVLSVDQFYRKAGSENGRQSRCKPCMSLDSLDRWRAKHPPKRETTLLPDGRKRCGSCERVLPVAEFAPRGDGSGVRSECRSCRRLTTQAYNDAHREERKERGRRYYRENTERVKASAQAFAAAHPEKYRQIHSDWKRRNKDAVNASTHKRRARLRHNGGAWTEADWQRLKALCDWRCVMCGRQEITDGITLCFDHVVPLSLGGFNLISNGQPLCRSCNSTKHRRVLDLRPAALRL